MLYWCWFRRISDGMETLPPWIKDKVDADTFLTMEGLYGWERFCHPIMCTSPDYKEN